MTEQTTFGTLLRAHRLAAGLTQEELAELAHISVRAVSDIERGVNRRPYKSTVTSLADALGLAGEERAGFVGSVRRTAAVMPPPREHVDDVTEVPIGPSCSAEASEPPSAPWWKQHNFVTLLAAVAVLLALVGAFALYRVTAPVATRVQSGVTAQSTAERRELVRTVLRSDEAYRAARACACPAALSTAKVDPDLTKYRRQILDLRRHGERIRTTHHSLHVIAVTVESQTVGQVLVSKDETAEIWRHGRLAEVCSGPYRVRYHVIRTPAGWRVDDTQLITGQACHSV